MSKGYTDPDERTLINITSYHQSLQRLQEAKNQALVSPKLNYKQPLHYTEYQMERCSGIYKNITINTWQLHTYQCFPRWRLLEHKFRKYK